MYMRATCWPVLLRRVSMKEDASTKKKNLSIVQEKQYFGAHRWDNTCKCRDGCHVVLNMNNGQIP